MIIVSIIIVIIIIIIIIDIIQSQLKTLAVLWIIVCIIVVRLNWQALAKWFVVAEFCVDGNINIIEKLLVNLINSSTLSANSGVDGFLNNHDGRNRLI